MSRCRCSATASRAVALGDRDCSVQRRYQKLFEEAPAPLLPDALRAEMAAAALALAEHLHYRGLGTVELLVDRERGTFYFLEMNARIQVEHPVTEMVTGLDLVAEQLAVAEGLPLRIRQEDVVLTGHAVECRINAEDWAHGFRPSPGRIDRVVLPVGDGLRVDTHVQGGSVVPPYYDSLLAKLIVHGRDRADALARARAALDLLRIDGVTTTVPVHQALLADPEFAAGGVDTAFFERFLERPPGGGGLMADVGLVDVSLRDGNQSLWGATGLRTAHVAAGRPAAGAGRLPGAGLQLQHRDGRRCPHPPGGPVGAAPADPRGHADDEAAVHRHRLPLHQLAELPSRHDAAGLRPARRQRHRPRRRPRPDARHGRRPRDRPAAEAGRASTR